MIDQRFFKQIAKINKSVAWEFVVLHNLLCELWYLHRTGIILGPYSQEEIDENEHNEYYDNGNPAITKVNLRIPRKLPCNLKDISVITKIVFKGGMISVNAPIRGSPSPQRNCRGRRFEG